MSSSEYYYPGTLPLDFQYLSSPRRTSLPLDCTKAKAFSLPLKRVDFEKSGHSILNFLLEAGLLNCYNAHSMALELFGLVQNSLQSLDGTRVYSYMHARVRGVDALLVGHGLLNEENTDKLSKLFALEFS